MDATLDTMYVLLFNQYHVNQSSLHALQWARSFSE